MQTESPAQTSSLETRRVWRTARGGRDQRGISAIELLVVVGILGVSLAVALPAMHNFLEESKVEAALTQVEGSVQRVRIGALKEKTAHRLLISDSDDASPNRLEIQRWTGSAFVTLESHDVPSGVTILGSGSTNSVDSVTANQRGMCTAGSVFVVGANGAVRATTIEATCLVDRS